MQHICKISITNDLPKSTESVAKRINSDTYKFSTEKEISPNFGIIGLREYEDGFSLSEGCDCWLSPFEADEKAFTLQERIEIANYQIDLWKRYKNTLVPEKKTKTLWIVVDKRPDKFGHHHTSDGFPWEQNVKEDYLTQIKIEIEVENE